VLAASPTSPRRRRQQHDCCEVSAPSASVSMGEGGSTEEEQQEREGLLGSSPSVPVRVRPHSVSATAVDAQRSAPAVHATFVEAHGHHVPTCSGRCLAVSSESESAVDLSYISALLVVGPVGMWLYGVLPELWAQLGALGPIACLLTLGACGADMFFLFSAKYTEPGILHTELVDEEALGGASQVDQWRDSAPRTAGGKVQSVRLDAQLFPLLKFRAKFCRETDNCIESFDHYCPWVGNAVGCRNYKHFFFFVAGANVVAVLVLITSIVVLVLVVRRLQLSLVMAVAMVPVAAGLIAYTIIIIMSVGGLFIYHVGLISTNVTTNESIKGTYRRRRNPHNKGLAANWREFLYKPLNGRGSYVCGSSNVHDALGMAGAV
jgi:hypothetical protein